MYDPSIGRWISEDPLGFGAEDVNLYRYVANRPTTGTDPSGLERFETRAARQALAEGLRSAPSFDALLTNTEVDAALRRAWRDSNPDALAVRAGQPGSLKREQGGFIIWNGVTRRLIITRVPAGTRDSLPIGDSPAGIGEITLAWFHTHPNIRAEGYLADPGPADIGVSRRLGIPGIVETHEGRKTIRI